MYNTRSYFGLHLKKNNKIRRSRKQKWLRKTSIKNRVLDTLKKDYSTISSEISLNALLIHEMTSSFGGFFWWSVNVESWIPSTIHCIQLFHYSRNKGYRAEVNLQGIRPKLVFPFASSSLFTWIFY